MVTPVITKIAEFATKHKTLTGTVILLTGALIALALAMTTIGLIYPNLVAGF